MEFKKIIEMLRDNDHTVMAMAIKCKNAEELITLAKEKGIKISVEDAEVILKLSLEAIEISDDDLDAVAGGQISDFLNSSSDKHIDGMPTNLIN